MKTELVIFVESRIYVEKMGCVWTKKPKHNEKTSLFFLESLGVESSPNNSISLKLMHCVHVRKRCQSSFIEMYFLAKVTECEVKNRDVI